MAENKTQETESSVQAFLDQIDDEQRRKDCYAVLTLMREVSGYEPRMWGTSIVGFGKYHYKYESGRQGDSLMIGFSPRKQALTLYLMGGFEEGGETLRKLGKHKTGKGCLYINRLADVDLSVLRAMMQHSLDFVRRTYPDAQG